jgi:signal transduction histidine kinase/ActR/RegA family two-component response regulator
VAVILVDVCMPELDGYELAAMVRQHPRCQRTAIIFVSAVLLTEVDRLRGYECGAVDYVPVPVVPEILRAKVSVFAELYRKTTALERFNAELEQRVAQRTAELEASTAALQQADKRKDEFLAMLAHELRNPLAPIRTAATLLRLKDLPDSHRVRARDIIERQVDHLVCLIDDLLDVSRITRGLIKLQLEPVSIGAVVAAAVETTRPVLDARKHELTLQLPDEPITIQGDKTRLVQAVGNVLHNAAKFTDTGGRIVLKVARDGPHVHISITDTGIGIASELLPRIFDLFAQVHPKSERSQGGLGIGLALVRRLVEMHGGSVSARSDGPDRGTEIRIQLPLVSAHAAAVPALTRPEAIPIVRSRRILVADDNHDAAEGLATLLQLGGHEVRVAHDGEEALAVSEAFEPHIVLLDLGMPKMDGFETARQMRRQPWGNRAKLVALTGWGQQSDRQLTTDAGFDAHLVKPVTDFDLFHALVEDRATESSTGAASAG